MQSEMTNAEAVQMMNRCKSIAMFDLFIDKLALPKAKKKLRKERKP